MRHSEHPRRHVRGGGRLLLLLLAALAAVPMARAQTAAGGDSLDALLKALSRYDGGLDSAAAWRLRDHVQARKDDPTARLGVETKLVQFLRGPATLAARMIASRHLRTIAGDTAVPALRSMLADERTTDLALDVLSAIPGRAADAALLQALPGARGATRTAVVAALGDRKVTEAVVALVPLLDQPAVAGPAALALGAIGGEAAATALSSAYRKAAPDRKPAIAAALLQCAEQALRAKHEAAALALYDLLSADTTLPAASRRAASMGRIAASGDRAPQRLVEMLTASDPAAQEAAVARIGDVFGPKSDIAVVSAALPRLPAAVQVQLLAVLPSYAGTLPTILEAARSEGEDVRVAALKALAAAGDASVVTWVAERAASARGAEQAAARATLGGLRGRAVDEAIMARVGDAPEPVRAEMLLAIADRRIFSAKPAVAAALASTSPRLRANALKALRAIGTPSDVPVVLDLLLTAGDGPDRAEAEATAAALAQKTLRADTRAGVVKTRLQNEKDAPTRVRLMALLPRIGDDSALPLLRTALADTSEEVRDAAVRALVAWPTTAARDDVLALARESRNETHRLLAIDGLIRLVGVDRYRAPGAAIADLQAAAAFSWRPEEQRLVLGAAVHFPCGEALALARGFLREPAVRAEAEAAVKEITARMK